MDKIVRRGHTGSVKMSGHKAGARGGVGRVDGKITSYQLGVLDNNAATEYEWNVEQGE